MVLGSGKSGDNVDKWKANNKSRKKNPQISHPTDRWLVTLAYQEIIFSIRKKSIFLWNYQGPIFFYCNISLNTEFSLISVFKLGKAIK